MLSLRIPSLGKDCFAAVSADQGLNRTCIPGRLNSPAMTGTKEQRDLAALQNAIYREKVLRARAMTPEQRLTEAFELTDEIFQSMHRGAMSQLGTDDPEEGWREVRRRLDRLTAHHERDLYADRLPEPV